MLVKTCLVRKRPGAKASRRFPTRHFPTSDIFYIRNILPRCCPTKKCPYKYIFLPRHILTTKLVRAECVRCPWLLAET